MQEPVILDGVGQQPRRQLGTRARAEGTEAQPLLQLCGMTPTILLRCQILLNGFGQDIDLVGDKRDQGGGRSLVGSQRPAGMTQVAQHDSVAEAAMVAAAAADDRDVAIGQCVVTDQLALVGRWIIERGDLRFRQLLPSSHAPLLELCGRRTSRSGPGSQSRCCA